MTPRVQPRRSGAEPPPEPETVPETQKPKEGEPMEPVKGCGKREWKIRRRNVVVLALYWLADDQGLVCEATNAAIARQAGSTRRPSADRAGRAISGRNNWTSLERLPML